MSPIQAGQTLKARSVCDYNCVFSAEVIERKGGFVTLKSQGLIRRKKVMTDDRGEYVYALGKYSMAPVFRSSGLPVFRALHSRPFPAMKPTNKIK